MTDIPLIRPKGQRVPHSDAVVSVTLAFAPYETVLPVAVGAFRAAQGHSLLEDVHDRKECVMLRLREKEQQANVFHLYAGTILAPKTAPGITVIEDWFGPDRNALGHLLPETRFFSIFSLWEKATEEQHCYTLRQGPEILRHVSLDRNMTKSGWTWEEEGEVQPWEDADRLSARALSKRCDRPLLFRYAETLGCDLQAVLGSARCVTEAKLVRAIGHWDTTPDSQPTSVGEEYRKAAIDAGFGGSDTYEDFEEQKRVAEEAQAGYAEELETAARINRSRTAKGLMKVMLETAPDPADRWSGHRRVSNWRLAIRRAYRAFPDDPNLPELETRALRETKGNPGSLTESELARTKAEALRSKDMTRHVAAYRKVIDTAASTGDLLEGCLMFMGALGARFEMQFRLNALMEFLRAAIKRDLRSEACDTIARFHDSLQRKAGQIAKDQTGDGARTLENARRRVT